MISSKMNKEIEIRYLPVKVYWLVPSFPVISPLLVEQLL